MIPELERFKTNKARTVTLDDAIDVCKVVENAISPNLPCHVALTGGALYKDGERKDIDLLFYRVRQYDHPPKEAILHRLKEVGFVIKGGYDWCTKSTFRGFDIDLFFPELYPEVSEDGGDY